MTSLCALLADWTGSLPEGGAMCEAKIDGFRALYFPGIDGVWRLWSRQGMPIEGVAHITHRLAQMQRAAGQPMMLDGELQVAGTLAATKAWCERGWKQGGTAGVLHLFDAVPLDDWKRGECPIPLYERKKGLSRLLDATGGEWEWRPGSRGADDPDCVRVIPDEWAFTDRDVIQAARRIWAVGGEGCVVKDAESPYRRKRSDAWQKIKIENQHKWAARPIAA